MKTINIDFDRLFNKTKNLSNELNSNLLQENIKTILQSINDKLLLVVTGDVNSGKSSLINKLLNNELCKVSPQPETDAVTYIKYGNNSNYTNDNMKFVFTTNNLLKTTNIIDTPGNNSIIELHTQITENFLPAADYVFFILDISNPYSKAWIHQIQSIYKYWSQNIILVFHKTDLIEKQDVKKNITNINKYLKEKDIHTYKTFKTSIFDNNSIQKLVNFVEKEISNKKLIDLKNNSKLKKIKTILSKLDKELDLLDKQREKDKKAIETINQEIYTSKSTVFDVSKETTRNILINYDRETDELIEYIYDYIEDNKIIERRIFKFFRKNNSVIENIKNRINKFEENIKLQISQELNSSMNIIYTTIISSLKDILKTLDNSDIGKFNPIYTKNLYQRDEFIELIHSRITEILNDGERYSEILTQEDIKNLNNIVLSSLAVSASGFLLAAIIPGAIISLTGIGLGIIGILIASISFGYNKNSIIKRIMKKIKKQRVKLEKQLNTKLFETIETFYSSIEKDFSPFINKNKELDSKLKSIKEEINSIKNDINL